MASLDLYPEGTKVWVADEKEVWLQAEVTCNPSSNGAGIDIEVCGERKVFVSAQGALPPLRNPDILIGANDLTSLSYLHEPAVLYNLRVRFQQSGTVYTYCGIVLVAINPYQPLPIYGSEIAAAYSGRQPGDLDPHIFAIAEEAYARMARESCSQSIIVSGESGAGKTVSAKYTMSYFAAVGGAESHDSYIERKVLASNPIMEAIGNARTVRNDNSSRYGKYIQIKFNTKHEITGAHMSTYLLEKSRSVRPSSGERNYHIFYQLCSSWDQDDFRHLQLGNPGEFNYTGQSGCVHIAGVNDQLELNNTREAMQLLGFHGDHEAFLFQILASILHLGNVKVGVAYSGGEEVSAISLDDHHLIMTSELLAVDRNELRVWLTHRLITTTREQFKKPLSPSQAINARDGLSKHLYAHLFDWVVEQINQSLSTQQSHDTCFIGVLDIYGFEVFDVNGFEQFCINYANEKLQQQFNQHVFKLDQEEYIREAIEWSFIDFYDNQPTIDLIESRLGILDLLDETCRLPSSSDDLFILKLYSSHKDKSQSFSKPRTSNCLFCVHHYAGIVQYHKKSFVEKNVDSIFDEYIRLIRSSQNKLVAKLFQGSPMKVTKTTQRNVKGGGSIKKETVGSQFRSSLSLLMATLSSTSPHYVRCIKPNNVKAPFTFDPRHVIQQLRACGVLETVRISAAGYPSRWLYTLFHQRYKMLIPTGQRRRGELKQMASYILQDTIKDPDKYIFGKSKVFFRAGQVAYLEKLRTHKLNTSGVVIQKHIRGWLQRRRYCRLKVAVLRIQTMARGMAARRWAWHLRQTKAAICLQKHFRRFSARIKFLRLRKTCLSIQTYCRGWSARRKFTALLRNRKAVVIQTSVRRWLCQVWYRRTLKQVVLVQCCVRRWRAKRQLKALKVEARSMDRLKFVNKGLENKIIELQQKLIDQIKCNNVLTAKTMRLETQLKSDRNKLAEQGKTELAQFQLSIETERAGRTTAEELLNHEREAHMETRRKLSALEDQVSILQDRLENMESRDTDQVIGVNHVTRSHDAPSTFTEDSLATELAGTPLMSTPSRSISMTTSESRTPVRQTFSYCDPTSPLQVSPPRRHMRKFHPHLEQTPPTSTRYSVSPSKPLLWKRKNESLHGSVNKIRSMLSNIELNTSQLESTRSKVSRTVQGVGLIKGKSLPDELLLALRQALETIDSLYSFNSELLEELDQMSLDSLVVASPPQPGTPVRKQSLPLTPLSPHSHRNKPALSRLMSLKTWSPSIDQSQDSLMESPNLGMLKWDLHNLSELVKLLVLGMEPGRIHGHVPCLPAHMIFMCIRYADHINNAEQASHLMDGVINSLQKVTHRNHNNIELLSFWMANTCQLVHNIKQYSGKEVSNSKHHRHLMNFDLTEHHHILTHRVIAIYHQLMELVYTRLKLMIVSGLVDFEAIPGMSSSHPIGSKPSSNKYSTQKVTVEMVVKEIDSIVKTLQRNAVDLDIINQIVRQMFFIINATMLNNLLLRRELCHWSKGVQMRYNISQLEDWCRRHGLSSSGALVELLPIVEASKLLQMRKSSDSDVPVICDLCTHLNALQVQKILSMYTPADEYEEKVPVSVVRLFVEMGGADQVDPNNLMVDVHRLYPLQLGHVPADISFQSIAIATNILGDFLSLI